MTHISNSTILVVGGKILTTDDFVFKARQESVNDVIDDFGPPIINLVSPSLLKEGERIEIIMSGNRTYNPLQASISGVGVSVDSVEVNADDQITIVTTTSEDAVSSGDGSELRDITITTLAAPDGSDLTDPDGNVLTSSTTLAQAFRVYFAEPSLSGSSATSFEQGAQYTIFLSGSKMYDKWDGTQPMTVDLGAGLTATSIQVLDKNAAQVQFTVDAQAARGTRSVDATTYSGSASENNDDLADALEVYYRAPEVTRMHSLSGDDTIDSDTDTVEMEAGETFSLQLTGARLEGISQPGRIVFLDENDQPYTDESDQPYIAVSNQAENTPAGTGAGHTASFTATVASDAPEAQGLRVQYQTLSATGTHTAEFLPGQTGLQIVPADPTIASFSIAARPGLVGSDDNVIELGDDTRGCVITGKNIRAGYSLKVMKDAGGVVTDASNEFAISDEVLTDNAADADDTLAFNIKTNGASETDAGGQLKYFFKIETASGSSNAAAAWGANQLVVLPGNPTLIAGQDGVNHASIRKSADTGTTAVSFNIEGTNIYNSVADNADLSNWASIADDTSGVFADGAGNGKMKIDMTNAASFSDLKCVAQSDNVALITATMDNSVAEGLKDITITTRSGAVTLVGVLDVLPPAPTVSSVSPNLQEEGTTATLTVSGADFFPLGAGAAGQAAGNGGGASEELEMEYAEVLKGIFEETMETLPEPLDPQAPTAAELQSQIAHLQTGIDDIQAINDDFDAQGVDIAPGKEMIEELEHMKKEAQEQLGES